MIGGPAWGGRADDDAGMQALETDVMRFMAILAFCLLAVFALVQSVPWSPEAPTVESPPAAAGPLAAPERQSLAAAPKQTVASVPAAVAPRPVEVVKPGTPRTFTPARQMQKDPPAPVPDEPEVVQTALPRRPGAETANGTVQGTSPVHTSDEMESETGDHVAPVQEAPVGPAAQPVPGPEKNSSLPGSADQQNGFTLRFATDEAMFGLIESGAVSLYALGESTAWRLAASGGRYSFHAAAPPQQIYEMTPATVPADLLRALRRRANVAVDSVNWGVVLPATTRAAIAAAMRDADGGQLSIQTDGRVRLE